MSEFRHLVLGLDRMFVGKRDCDDCVDSEGVWSRRVGYGRRYEYDKPYTIGP